MTASARKVWTPEAVRELGVSADVPTAGAILGLGRDEAYRAVKRGTFPVEVVRVGRRIVVPTVPLLRLLGIEDGGEDDP